LAPVDREERNTAVIKSNLEIKPGREREITWREREKGGYKLGLQKEGLETGVGRERDGS